MPERARIKFDDEGESKPTSDNGGFPNKKRKAADAFSSITSTTPKKPEPQYFLQRHRQNRPTANGKNVDFTQQQDSQSVQDVKADQPRKAGLKHRAGQLMVSRQKLPIWNHATEIKDKVRESDVLLLVGETGSGKSTQVPQFLLDESWCSRKTSASGMKVGGSVAITQPRRVAAISLARRVAEEMGTPLGNASPASLVGYSVRFDNSTSPSTRIKFLTDGMLLQEMLRDPWMKEYSVVVVDEVHERGANVDLVLGFLKKIVQGRNKNDGRGGVPLKVVVMSATADMEKISGFFHTEKQEGENGDEGNEELQKSQGADDFSGFSDDEDTKITTKVDQQLDIKTGSCFIKGRQYPVTITYTPQPVPNALDAAMERIMHLHTHTPLPGDILVFLTGQETVESLESLCQTYAESLQVQSKQKGAPRLPHLQILPLFAALPTHLQQRVFQPTPSFTRKIILSTNIAETSVTVPGVRHVIDTGKRKARHFRPALNLDTLLTTPISRSSANQRSGRAGREAPGTCHRLYTQQDFYKLVADTEPEILRCDLSQLVLTLKAHDIDDIMSFPLLTPPPRRSLERALIHLLQLNALDPKTGQITPLGRRMNALPLPANLARILLASQTPRYNCVEEIIDIVSGLSVENIWLPTHQNQHSSNKPSETEEDESLNPIQVARQTLFRREGDHLTLLAAMQAYTADNTDRKEWCRRHGISHRAMSSALDVRKQLTKLSSSSKPRPNPKQVPDNQSSPLSERILRCLLTGFHPNIARISSSAASTSAKPNAKPTAPGANYKTLLTAQALSIHPSSVLFARTPKPATVLYSEFVYTNRPYARTCSAVEMAWLDALDGEGEEMGS